MKTKVVVNGLFLLALVALEARAATPPVRWTPASVEQTLGLGRASTVHVSFTSQQPLTNVDLWVTPELQPFVVVTPTHFDSIQRNTAYPVTLQLLAPFGALPQPFSGTIHVRLGPTTYPQTLKVNLRMFDAAEAIGPAGGVIEVLDPASPLYRTRLEIPEGALTEGRFLTLNRVLDPPALPLWVSRLGDFVQFSGEGDFSLNISARLFAPYHDDDDDGTVDGTSVSEFSGLGAMWYNPLSGGWENCEDVEAEGSENFIRIVVASASILTPVMFDNTGPSLRILTYNTALTVTLMPNPDITDPVTGKVFDFDVSEDVRRRVRLVTEGLRRVDPDIIGLMEVFDDWAEENMRDFLEPAYPHYVRYLDGDTMWMQDSGLMLFAKHGFPFIRFTERIDPINTPGEGNCKARNGSLGNWCGQVAFADFGSVCESFDCMANKGAGMVRVSNSYSGDDFTVVFTHLQASYGNDDEDDRRQQVANRQQQLFYIRQMIERNLTPLEIDFEPMFMLGDLNINGHTQSDNPNMPSFWEWHSVFDDALYGVYPRGLCACGLNPCPDSDRISMFTDTWKYETSPDDFGRTVGCNFLFSPYDRLCGERLDYILHSSPKNVCAQHIAIAWNVHHQGSAHPYSDHLPVLADFNWSAAHCSAVEGREVPHIEKGEEDTYPDGVIKHPGSMQWHIIREPGAYAIAVSTSTPQPRVAFDIYDKTDLSRPMTPSLATPHPKFGPRYNMPDPPYYIRVYAQDWVNDRAVPDRKWYGDYKIMIHRLSCTSKIEACPLDPVVRNETNLNDWPALPVGFEDTMWFSFTTDQGERGDFPTLKFYLALPDGVVVDDYDAANYELEIETTDAVRFPFFATGVADEGRQISAFATGLVGGDGQEKEYYVKVRRKERLGPQTTQVFYHTNLTYFYPELLACVTQDDPTGDDDIYYYIEVDSPAGWYDERVLEVEDDPEWSYLAEFDTGASFGVRRRWGDPSRHGYPRKFVKWVVINLVEYDRGSDNDAQIAHGYRESPPNWRVEPLAENLEEQRGELIWWSDIPPLPPLWNLHYSLAGKLTHTPPKESTPTAFE